MRKYILFVFMFNIFLISYAQTGGREKPTLLFSYDESGNQIKRFFEIIVSVPRGNVQAVEDSTIETIFQVVPNPTSGPFNIRWNSTEEIQDIELYDLASIQIKNYTVNRNLGNIEINISSVPAGIYILRFITTKGKVITKKIIKK